MTKTKTKTIIKTMTKSMTKKITQKVTKTKCSLFVSQVAPHSHWTGRLSVSRLEKILTLMLTIVLMMVLCSNCAEMLVVVLRWR